MESCFKTFTHELVCVLGIDSRTQSKEINGKKRMLARRRCIKEVWITYARLSLFKQHRKPVVSLSVCLFFKDYFFCLYVSKSWKT